MTFPTVEPPESVRQAHVRMTRPAANGEEVHIVVGPFQRHVRATVKDDVGKDMILRHYEVDGMPATTYGPIRFAISRENGTWHFPGGFGCD